MTPRATATGSPLRSRARKALKRVEELAERYQAEGLSPEEAKSKAYEVLRDNPKGDWRRNPERQTRAPVGKLKKKRPKKKAK